ncbi:helicase [Aureococcus anophagefferens]|nr:helicase [Aureococcus anophagefferens]
MGLGKTLQSISMLGYLHEFKRINGPHLVLVPKTTLSNWMNEFPPGALDDLFDLQIDDADAKQRLIGQLHKLLRPFVLRRLKADVEKSLPPKSETILFTSMTATQRDVYKQCLLREIDVVQGGSGKGGGRTAVLNLLVLLDKLLTRLKDKGHRVLIFSQMTRMLDILEDFMVMRYRRLLPHRRQDGPRAPRGVHRRLQRPELEKFAFLLSTRAGGLGINLQTADTRASHDSDWNPQADLQAMDRCHRIGQTKPVHVYRLVTEHSVEEKVVERAQQKLKLDAAVQQGRLHDKERKLQTDELLHAVRFGADKVFRGGGDASELSDLDIDAIIALADATADLEARLEAPEKGDMLDFKLDGGMATQQWEGVDYAAVQDQKKRGLDANPGKGSVFGRHGQARSEAPSDSIYATDKMISEHLDLHPKRKKARGEGKDEEEEKETQVRVEVSATRRLLKRGASVFAPSDWDRISRAVEKGEKKLEEMTRTRR